MGLQIQCRFMLTLCCLGFVVCVRIKMDEGNAIVFFYETTIRGY